ncbi:MAG: peptidylprolyl isomerase [Terracidiphilus sp.]
MIRFLQRDNRLTKAFFIVIIAAASVGMVVYLIPGLMGMGGASSSDYAMVYPHWYSRLLSSGYAVTQQRVNELARTQLQQRAPQYAENPTILGIFEQQVGQQLIQQQILLAEAAKLGIRASDDDVRQFLHKGQFGEILFPGGQFIGQDRYADFVARQFNLSVAAFEQEVKEDIVIHRLEALITAGVTVSDQQVRDAYRKANVKIKFDYAVISSDDLRKTIHPTDSQLEAFFQKNAAQYATAVPEQRRITYFAFTADQLPGGVPQPSQQEIQQYYNEHLSDYQIPEQARSRHILISVPPGADAKTDAAAKARAEGILQQLQHGANFAALAKKYSDDPGSKDKGGELGFAQRGTMVPAFDNAIFTQKIGAIKIVKTQFGYHIVQVEEREPAHTEALNEVLPTIQATLIRQNVAKAEQDYAEALTSEAIKNGLQKTAAAHHLQLSTTPLVAEQGVISALPDSSRILQKAFASKQGDPPQFAATGEGYAIFQVTGVVPAHAPSFADWKSHVADDYRSEQLPGLLSQKTAELAEKARELNDLAKAANEVGATMKTSDLVNETGQVPDLGAVGQVAPQLFNMNVGAISGPIDAGRTGVVARLIDKQEPTAAEIAQNFDQTKDRILDQRRVQAFNIFLSNLVEQYKRHNLIRVFKTPADQIPGA